MASYSVAESKHATLVASTVDTVTVTGDFANVEVLNRTGTAEIYFTVSSTVAPTVKGADTKVVAAAAGAALTSGRRESTLVVKLISSGTPEYSVTGI